MYHDLSHNLAGLAPGRRHRPVGRVLGRAAVRVLDTFALWRERRAERRALARLDDRLLADIGVGRHDVAREIAKPFWRG